MSPQAAYGRADTLLLDMDGTLLDLAFDNHMWRDVVPRHYAAANDLSFQASCDYLFGQLAEVRGDLEWYCLDHWSDRLSLDIVQLHHDMNHRIGYLPGALRFLREVHAQCVRVLLVTNAHPDLLALKDAMTGLGDYFDGMYSSHSYGIPKEKPDFWHALQADVGFDPTTTLFVDDSQAVLRSAREYGIDLLLTVTRPDTTRPLQPSSEFRGVEQVLDMLEPLASVSPRRP